MASCNERQLGFTLIELLVVIAIVAVLAAMLFPVLAKARERNAAETCLSNEQRLGIAVLQYVFDNDGTFPLAERYANTGEQKLLADEFYPTVPWHWVVSPYVIGGNRRSNHVGDMEFAGGVWSCPDFPVVAPMNYGLSDSIGGDSSFYAYQSFFGPHKSMTLWDLRTPGRNILIAEKGYMGGSVYPAYTQPGLMTEEYLYTPDASIIQVSNDNDGIATPAAEYPPPSFVPRFRHNGRCNVVYADCHVRPVTLASMSGLKNWCTSVYAPNPDLPSWYPYQVNGQTCSDVVH